MYQRFRSYDRLKAIFLLGVIFIHSAIFLYKGIDTLDFNNPPLVVIILSLLISWGGMFIMLSCLVNNYTLVKKINQGDITSAESFRHILIYVAFLLCLHPIYTVLVGPTTFDFATGHHKYTAVQELVRFGQLSHLRWDKIFECSIFTAIGANLLFTSLVTRLYIKNRRRWQPGLFYKMGFGLAILFLATGYIRMILFEPFWNARESGNMLVAALGFLFIDKPYPLLPYLSFGLVGALLGIMLAEDQPKRWVQKYLFSIGVLSFLAGIGGYIFLPKSANNVDLTWLCKVLMEFGIFQVIMGFIYPNPHTAPTRPNVIDRFFYQVATTTLTVYMLQQPVTEIWARLLDAMFKDWNFSIENALWFGLANLILWGAVIILLKDRLKQVGVERLWVEFSRRLQRLSYRSNSPGIFPKQDSALSLREEP